MTTLGLALRARLVTGWQAHRLHGPGAVGSRRQHSRDQRRRHRRRQSRPTRLRNCSRPGRRTAPRSRSLSRVGVPYQIYHRCRRCGNRTQVDVSEQSRSASPSWQPLGPDAPTRLHHCPVNAAPRSGPPTTGLRDGHLSAAPPTPTATRSISRSRASRRTSRTRGSADAIATTQPDRVRLRAERDPRGDGRVYRIAFEAADGRAALHRHGDRRGPCARATRRSTPRRRATTRFAPRARTSIRCMFIDVRLFAMLRERAGSDTVTVEVPDGATVRDALDAVAAHARAGRRDGAHVRS